MSRNPDSTAGPRVIAPGMDAQVVAVIDQRLAMVEREHEVTIAFAVESGSRAWGFPSPDSDYDCRFVYLRRSSDYLSLFPKRDVIETELTPVLDVNGWDLAKALKLLLKGNAVIIEWLTSPIVYREIEDFRAALLAFAHETADRELIARHYIHLAKRQLQEKLADLDSVPLKRLFYALRPAIALRWMRLHPGAAVAPMNFRELCAEADLAPDLALMIAELLARKAETRELGHGPVPQPIRDVIAAELRDAESRFAGSAAASADNRVRADAFFQRMLRQHGGR